MIKDTTIETHSSYGPKKVRVQVGRAVRKGVSSIGTPYKKGDSILHFSSNRNTGEVFILTKSDFNHFNGLWWSNDKLPWVKTIAK